MYTITSEEYFNDNPEALKREDNIIKTLALIYTGTMKALEEKYGPEVIDVARKGFLEAKLSADKEAFAKMEEKSVEKYCEWLNGILHLTHEFTMTYDESKNEAQYNITKCPWATYFREFHGEKYGIFFCEADCPMVDYYGANVGFDRTKVLMDGGECCNHRYFDKSKEK